MLFSGYLQFRSLAKSYHTSHPVAFRGLLVTLGRYENYEEMISMIVQSHALLCLIVGGDFDLLKFFTLHSIL